MTDQIEKLFAELRAETLPTVRPPGTEPLRKAVRLRRAVLSAAAAVVVLAAGGLIAMIRPGQGPAPVATTPSAAPTYSGATLKARVAEALNVDLDDTAPAIGGIITDTGSGPKESRRAVLGGTYDVRMVCYGSGSMTVTVATGAVGTEPLVEMRSLPCDTAGKLVTVVVDVAGDSGTLTVRIEPEVAGPGRAAFGWDAQLWQSDKSRWQQAAGDALGEQRSGYSGSGATFVSDGGTGYQQDEIEPGRYRVRAVCLGFGTVKLAVGPASDGDDPPPADTAVVRCSPDTPGTASVTYKATSKGIYYYFEPDTDAQHRSAVATVLERY